MSVIRDDWNWRRALLASDLKSTTKHVLLTLSMHASEAGHGILPSKKTLARECSLTERSIVEHLRIGSDLGWIGKRERFTPSGRQTSNEYVLTRPEGEGESHSPPEAYSPPEGESPSPLTTLKGSQERAHGSTGSRRRKNVPIPDGFQADRTHLEIALANGLDIEHELMAFRDYHEKHDSRFRNWTAAFRTWLRKAVEFRGGSAEPAASGKGFY